ncbi:hypothetical protein BEWA_013580 [Theileria equi strain WA]|uniref:Uncharacterized protein n=1 Tax=Theileria equi strain WA TaxID=1537102 RepID=L1LC00_THEEQ|nr:hypothetical protein BEWA_013580 [Theileria equi strain WA]EKX72799.1 hypothetical protein BEWA_013580 [Theileria equi strain WA]|eukprot:XP_004832251.1 hypothetical protein BEWA_013580 [Theileria equi strain WA]
MINEYRDEWDVLVLDFPKEPEDNVLCYYRNDSDRYNPETKKVAIPNVSNFTKYTHTVPGGKIFTLYTSIPNGENLELNGYQEIQDVMNVSVYYWNKDKSHRKKPLLIGITVKGSSGIETKHYGRNGNSNSSNPGIFDQLPSADWDVFGTTTESGFYDYKGHPTEHLAKKLDDLTCKYHKAATFDISFTNSNNISTISCTDQQRYCCEEHEKKGEGRISVERNGVSCNEPGHTSSHIAAYKHSIESSSKLAGIYYKEGANTRKYIRLSGLSFPTYDPVSAYAFYCNGSMNPVLIYIKDGPREVRNKWFKKPTSNKNTWEEVSGRLPGITPENISNNKCTYWNALVDVLSGTGCANYSRCSYNSGISVFGAKYTLPEGFRGEALPPSIHPAVNSLTDDHTTTQTTLITEDGHKAIEVTYADNQVFRVLGANGVAEVEQTQESQNSAVALPPQEKATKTQNDVDTPTDSYKQSDSDLSSQNNSHTGTDKGAGPDSVDYTSLPGDGETGALQDDQSYGGDTPEPEQIGTESAPLGLLAIFKISSGVFGGSGAAGFAGWKLYKSFKRDPWVRQI